MEDRETSRMRKYGESKTIRIVMATVLHVTSCLGLRKFQADGFFFPTVNFRPMGFLFDRLYIFNPVWITSVQDMCTKKKSYSVIWSSVKIFALEPTQQLGA